MSATLSPKARLDEQELAEGSAIRHRSTSPGNSLIRHNKRACQLLVVGRTLEGDYRHLAASGPASDGAVHRRGRRGSGEALDLRHPVRVVRAAIARDRRGRDRGAPLVRRDRPA